MAGGQSMTAVPPIASEFYAPQRKTPSAITGREQMQQYPNLLNHLVGADQERVRDRQAECLDGLEVDNQFHTSDNSIVVPMGYAEIRQGLGTA